MWLIEHSYVKKYLVPVWCWWRWDGWTGTEIGSSPPSPSILSLTNTRFRLGPVFPTSTNVSGTLRSKIFKYIRDGNIAPAFFFIRIILNNMHILYCQLCEHWTEMRNLWATPTTRRWWSSWRIGGLRNKAPRWPARRSRSTCTASRTGRSVTGWTRGDPLAGASTDNF